MNITYVNNTDLTGCRFNGYDLHHELNKDGYNAVQLVLDKHSTDPTVMTLSQIHFVLNVMERELGMTSLLCPYGKSLMSHAKFQDADIVHYHLIHNGVISILDFPNLTKVKPSVWTIHDPWAVTGHCIHPLECDKWKIGCINCERQERLSSPLVLSKATQMWNIKKKVYDEVDVDIIVSTDFSKHYIENSPLMCHFTRVHKIPFGIDVDGFTNTDKKKARYLFGVADSEFVISFRADISEYKGLLYILEMLNKLCINIPVVLLTIAGGWNAPKDLTEKFRVIELGWQNDVEVLRNFYAASDIFLMPSIAETFGMMAIEAMASGCPVIVFKDTVLEEVTFAPECGIAVEFKNSEMLRAAVEWLAANPEERVKRGEIGIKLANEHYSFRKYVDTHIELYNEILNRKNTKG